MEEEQGKKQDSKPGSRHVLFMLLSGDLLPGKTKQNNN
jgi:hypothetical protein